MWMGFDLIGFTGRCRVNECTRGVNFIFLLFHIRYIHSAEGTTCVCSHIIYRSSARALLCCHAVLARVDFARERKARVLSCFFLSVILRLLRAVRYFVCYMSQVELEE